MFDMRNGCGPGRNGTELRGISVVHGLMICMPRIASPYLILYSHRPPLVAVTWMPGETFGFHLSEPVCRLDKNTLAKGVEQTRTSMND